MLSVLVAGAAAAQSAIVVPSGQQITLHEVLVDDAPGETWVRFRFVAPQIAAEGGDIPHELAAFDMDHLCQALALPYLEQYTLNAARVVISLADRDVAFGDTAPDATQFFEIYRPKNGTCIWEEF